jgi:hypothetical protein
MADTLALPTRPPPPPPPPMDPERFDGSRSDPQPVPVPVRAHSTQVAAGWLEKIHPQERAELVAEEEKLGKATAPNSNQVCGAGSQFAQLAWPERKAERASIALHATPPPPPPPIPGPFTCSKLSHHIPTRPSVRRKRSRAPASQLHHPGGGVRAYAFINHCCPHTNTHRPHENELEPTIGRGPQLRALVRTGSWHPSIYQPFSPRLLLLLPSDS